MDYGHLAAESDSSRERFQWFLTAVFLFSLSTLSILFVMHIPYHNWAATLIPMTSWASKMKLMTAANVDFSMIIQEIKFNVFRSRSRWIPPWPVNFILSLGYFKWIKIPHSKAWREKVRWKGTFYQSRTLTNFIAFQPFFSFISMRKFIFQFFLREWQEFFFFATTEQKLFVDNKNEKNNNKFKSSKNKDLNNMNIKWQTCGSFQRRQETSVGNCCCPLLCVFNFHGKYTHNKLGEIRHNFLN